MPPTGHPSLTGLAAEAGTLVPCAGNLPVVLDDPAVVWLIDEGEIDLFVIETSGGNDLPASRHLLRAGSGRVLPGVAPDEGDTTLRLIAKGRPGTVLKRVPAATLAAAATEAFAEQMDIWIADLSDSLSRYVLHRPRPDSLVEPGPALPSAQGVCSARSGVAWVSAPGPGAGLFMDLLDWPEVNANGDAAPIPLTQASWLTLLGATPLTVRSSQTLAEEGTLLPALASFHAAAFGLERLNRRLAVVDQANLERARATNRRNDEEAARKRLFSLFDRSSDRDAHSGSAALAEALRVIGRRQGIAFEIPARRGGDNPPASLIDILDRSGVRARQVHLKPEDKWWLGDSSPMLAFRAEDGRPVALLPGKFGRYRAFDPSSGRSIPMTAERARALRTEAWLFYRPLPSSSMEPGDLLRFACHGSAGDLARLVLAGLPGGLLMLAPALALGFVADLISRGGDPGAFIAVSVGLAGLGLFVGLLHVLRGMTLMRLEARVVSRVEAAFWDRLLRLPSGVLNRYPTGDLAMRGMAFQSLRDAMQGAVADGLLSIIFLLPAFVLMFFYDTALAGVGLAFGLVSLLTTVLLGLRQVSPSSRMIRSVRGVAGRLFELIGGIGKLRVESAEGSAFAVWARDYREQKHAERELGVLDGHVQAFGTALPFLAGAALIFTTVLRDSPTILVGDFLVVYAVFIAFQAAVARFGESFGAVAACAPASEQIRPFLVQTPETVAQGEPVERLNGELLFDHVSFRYETDGPLILDNVTIHARPGEFVAIAGGSGAGKSTLFRLALGLDLPSSGAVYYDGRDLRHLNVKQLRRQIGAVPQAVQLHPQDLWDNIVAHHEDVTNQEVWQAAEAAAIDREIAAMPMGMMTPVGTSWAVLSGGESQRVTIARSLLRSPRLLLFDEATNWLDNESQTDVMDKLANLTSTRIVIAHRLSTLKQADRIYVMQSGRVQQSGSFEELMAVDGLFRDLVRRQIA